MKRAPTKLWVFVLQAANKQWFIRVVRSGKVFLNTETYKTRATANKIRDNMLKLGPLFANGEAKSRAVPYDIQQLPEWKATHPTTPYVQGANSTLC